MKLREVLLVSLLALGPMMAQDPAQLKDARHRLDLVATRAIANFRSADSIERRLNADGATLHPELTVLRLRIEAALDETQSALDKGDLENAREATGRAEGLVDRFARKLGGG
jgi:hypothetical protein